MYIARLQLKNFKSFGGNHDLLLSPGFTAIVGPNGSGKSNILDGLRWGLGDSSGTRLRITRQSDLLFQGTAILPPSKFAEVALELRNGDSRSVVRRKFSDDGGSVITVDGSKFRLQDLHEFKRDWHLDGDRFAFIGQGDVTDAISQRPMERRFHLEELFGIHLYRKKRDDALTKMESAEQELVRLGALVAELESRRRQIGPAVALAKKAVAIEAEMDRSRAKWYHLRRLFGENSLDELDRKLSEARKDVEYRRGWKIRWEQGLAGLKERARSIEIRKMDEERLLSEVEGALDVLRRQAFEMETSVRLEEDRLKRTDSDVTDLRTRISDLKSRREIEAGELSDLSLKAAEIGKNIEDLESRHREILSEMESQKAKRDACVKKQAELKTSLEGARALRNALLGSAEQRDPMKKRLQDDISAMEGNMEISSAREGDLNNSLELLRKEHRKADDVCKDLGARTQLLRKEIYRLESEVDHLSGSSSEGLYPRPVAHLLAASDLGKLSSRPTPVVEAFDCPPDLAVAMEAALGGRQFWLLGQTMDDAREGIEELKSAKAGRVTYLTLDRANPRRASTAAIDLKEEEIIGWAMDIISINEVWRPALEHMIGDLLVVGSYSAGASLASRGCRFPVVTRDGELFSPGGTVSGGQTGRPGGVLHARAKLKEAEESLRKRRKDLARLESTLKDSEARERELSASLEAMVSEVSLAERERLRGEKVLSDLRRDLDMLIAEARATEERERAISADIASKERELASTEKELCSLVSPEDGEVREKLSVLRPQLEVWAEKIRSSEARLSILDTDLERAGSDLSRYSAEIISIKERRDLQSLGLNDLRRQIIDRETEKERIADLIRNMDKGNRRIGSSLEKCLRRSTVASEKLEDGERTTGWLEQKYERERGRLDDLIAAWEEKFPYLGGLESTGDLEEEERSVRRLESALKDIGDFDRGALSEDASLAERLGYYEEQMKDVSCGIGELRALVDETDRQAGGVFKDALDRIDRRFDGLFQRLFGGGEAHLRLQSDGGLWDSGVDIIARPPGKISSYLTQLSGGEQTLTALSLLFSSMEVAKVPLAVLDEVDAALDEVNLRRFADIVTDYASSLQILAMTHRRQTMERADVMYGVTMSEPGLSQVVGVKLEDWR